MNDVRSVSTEHLPALMQAGATFLGALYSMVVLSLELTAIAVCVAPLIGGISAGVKRIVNRMEDDARVRVQLYFFLVVRKIPRSHFMMSRLLGPMRTRWQPRLLALQEL